MNRHISIFLDTNVIQVFLNGKNGSRVSLNQLDICPKYYELIEFIGRYNLCERVEICIPEIVVLEMRQHMVSGYSRQLQTLKGQLEDHKKVFGKIVDIGPIQENYKVEEYEKFVDRLFADFFKTPRNFAKQVPYPRDRSTMDVLIKKAVLGVRPFFAGKIGSKCHSDAGFKDSVLAETIFEYHRDTDNLCVLITHDNDFSTDFKNEVREDSAFVRFSSIDDAIVAIKKCYRISDVELVYDRFSGDKYLRCRVLEEAEMGLDASVTDFNVKQVIPNDDDTFIVKVWLVANETEYRFTVLYDYSANAIMKVEYKITND